MLKILQARFQQCVNHELSDVQAGFRKGRGARDQIDILSDMSIATPAFFWSLFAWKNLFPALHFQSVCVPCFELGLV